MRCSFKCKPLQDGVSSHTAVSELARPPCSGRSYTAVLHACTAISLVHNKCQRLRQLLQPIQVVLVAHMKTGWSTALQCSHAACQYLARTVAAFVGLSTSLTKASILLSFVAAALVLLAAACMLNICLLVLPLAIVIAPGCWLARTCWARRHWLSHSELRRVSSATVRQRQQTGPRPPWHHKRPQDTGQTQKASLPSLRQALQDLLTLRLPERLQVCSICLQDIRISQMLRLKDCHHKYCKACTATHLHTKLRDDQHDMLRCAFPQCTAMFTVAQCQEVLVHDAAVSSSAPMVLKLLC